MRLAKILMLPSLAVVLISCAGTTGLRGDLLDSVSVQTRQAVEKSCGSVPRSWGPPKNGSRYTVEELEAWSRRDRLDSLRCASPALIFTDHIRRRDTAIMKGQR